MRLLLIFVVCVSMSGCRTVGGSAPSEVKDAAGAAVICPSGSVYQAFQLEAVDPLPTVASVRLSTDERSSSPLRPITAGSNMRLDICWSSDESAPPRLMRVMYLAGSALNPVPREFSEPPSVSNGLAAAMEGDVSQLQIEIPFASGAVPAEDAALEIRGWQIGNTGFVTAGLFYRMANATTPRLLPSYNTALIGKLVAGDPFPAGLCAFGEDARISRLQVGAVRMEVKTCEFPGTGETTDYRVAGVDIRDDTLGLDEQQRHLTLSSAQIRTKTERGGQNCDANPVCFVVRHHNWCDSFVIKLPQVTYASTVPSPFGCNEGAILSGAPVIAAPSQQGENRASVLTIARGGVTTKVLYDGHYAFMTFEPL